MGGVLTKVCEELGGHLRGEVVIVPRRTCEVVLRTAAWRTTDDNIPVEVAIGLHASLDAPPAPGGPYRRDSKKTLAARPIIELRPREKSDAVGKWTRLDAEMETGDAEFDSLVYVESDSPQDLVRETLGDATTRTSISALLQAGCAHVSIDGDSRKLSATVWVQIENPRLTPVVDEFCRLHEQLPRFEGRVARPAWVRQAAQYAFVPLAVVGYILAHTMGERYPPVSSIANLLCVAVGIGAWLVLALIAFFSLRGRVKGMRKFVWIIVPAFAGLPLTSMGAATFVNGALDPHDSTDQRVQVLAKISNKDGDLFVRVADEGGRSLRIETDEALWESIRQGDEVVVTLSPGRLGWQWVAGIRKAQ